MSYNKLVRDNIVDIIKNKGEEPKFHFLNNTELLENLIIKIIEETNEVMEAKSTEELTLELADLLEVINSILQIKKVDLTLDNPIIYKNREELIKQINVSLKQLIGIKDISMSTLNEFITYILSFGNLYNIDTQTIINAMNLKRQQKGGFLKGIFLDDVVKTR